MALSRRQRQARLLALFREFGYIPGPEQWAIHREIPRFAIITGGERGGKSTLAAAHQYARACETAEKHQAEALLWLVGHEYDDVRGEWEYIKTYALMAEMVKNPKRDISEPRMGPVGLTAHPPGGGVVTLATRSAADTSRLVRESPHHMLICELGKLSHEAFLRCRGRASGTRGTILGSGTFEITGSYGWMARFWEEWQGENDWGGRSFNLPSWTNRARFPLAKNDPEIAALRRAYAHQPGLFEERVEGIPTKPATLVFREFQIGGENSHVAKVEFDPSEPVYIGVDPGMATPYAVVACQFISDYVMVFDEVYETDHTTEQIINICKNRVWWPNVQNKSAGAIDWSQEAEQRRWQQIAGVYLSRPKRRPVEDGILRLKDFLTGPEGAPLLFVDRENCPNLISEMTMYRRRDVSGAYEVREEPLDMWNHAIKALTYLVISRFGVVKYKDKPWRPFRSGSAFAPIREALGL